MSAEPSAIVTDEDAVTWTVAHEHHSARYEGSA
jgi:hypothetical protein